MPIMISPCPWCFSDVGVYQAVAITGRARLLWDNQAQPCGIISSNASRRPYSDAVRCRTCGHIRRDWIAVEGQLVYQGE